jgi:plasmid stabilization system protein ParE
MALQSRRVRWAQRARDALDDAAGYVAEDSIEAAVNLIDRALDAAESLSTMSERGHIVPELDDPTIREVFVYKYRLLYEVTPSEVIVLGFLHGACDFNRWWRDD